MTTDKVQNPQSGQDVVPAARQSSSAAVWLILLLLLCGVAAWGVGSYMVIRTDKETIVHRKRSFAFSPFYIDVREWGFVDYAKRPEVAAILAGHGCQMAADSLRDTRLNTPVKKVAEGVGEGIRKVSDSVKSFLDR